MFAHLSSDKPCDTMMNDFSLSRVCPFQMMHSLREQGFVVLYKLSCAQVFVHEG